MMRTLPLLLLAAGAALAADADFNGRWDIKGKPGSSIRAWWLEVNGAGTSSPSGKFVTAAGGDMNTITDMTVGNGELRFGYERRNREKKTAEKLLWRARLVDGKLDGTFEMEGSGRPPQGWIGMRAPVIGEKDDGSWVAGKPVSLFNGKDLSGWLPAEGWTVRDGALTNAPKVRNLVSAKTFWNFLLHVEYRVGAHSNSGIGLRGRYEIQILEDYGREPGTHSNGSLYSRIAPRVNASKPAGEWQTYDIRLVGRDLTVDLNGRRIIEHGVIEGLTAIANNADEAEPGPIVLQGDHGPVEFRQIVLTPLEKR